jgi:methionyl-tRNA synthetase
MPDKSKKYYLTTPIYYVNARPHIGHAYTTIAADVIARRQRTLLGLDEHGQPNVWFLTGTDEHGQKVQRSAQAAGITPQQFATQVSDQFRSLWKRMGITNDDYIRTTEPRHVAGVQKLFNELYSRGHIYLDTYTGQYSVGEEMFIDGPPGTIGPDGKPTETVTEENFYFRLSAYQPQLIDLIESGEFCIEPEARRNEVLSFLRGNVKEKLAEAFRELSGGSEPPVEDLATHPKLVPYCLDKGLIARSETSQEFYVPGALKDLSISRSSFDWGIPVPEPAASQTQKKHVIYVWLDALANYMTAVGYGAEKRADLTEEQKQAELNSFEKFWPADLHLVGKEIIRFHCVYWPAFLLAAGLPLPKKVQAHGWLLFEESKMSKSRGNIVRTETILDAFGSLLTTPTVSSRPERSEVEGSASPAAPQPPTKAEQDLFGADVLRYFLLREIPFGQDGSFSFDALVQRYNSDLANGYGNLVSRTLTMIEKNFEGAHPGLTSPATDALAEIANKVAGSAVALIDSVSDDFAALRFTRVLTNIAAFITEVDGFFSFGTPWKLAKSDDPVAKEDLRAILSTTAEAIRVITAVLNPILPYSTAKVWEQLGLGDIQLATGNGQLTSLQWGGLKPGTKLGPLGPIFPRAPKELIQQMTDAEQNNTASNAATPAEAPTPTHQAAPAPTPAAVPPTENGELTTDNSSPQIAIDDFVKIDLRVAKVLVAERIPKADKLLRLEVDLGYEKRQILSGIAQWYTPEDLIGRRIIIVANLAPRKMRGLESHGMLLAASHGEDGKPILATFAEGDEIELGSRLK